MLVPGGIESAPGTLRSRPMPKSCFRNVMPRSIRALSSLPCSFAVGRSRRVGIEPDAIAELAAEHLPARHAPGLAGQVHHGHLDAAHAAGLPRVAAELLDLAEDLVDVAGVLAEDAALEHQRVGLARAVAHLAPSRQAPGWCRCGSADTSSARRRPPPTRRSVILRADGSEARLTLAWTKSAAASAAASPVSAMRAGGAEAERLEE